MTEKTQEQETQQEQKSSEANIENILGNGNEAASDANYTGAAGSDNQDDDLTSDVLATMAVHGLAEYAELNYPCLKFDGEVKQKGVEKLTPLLEKYSVSSPFLNKWKIEIEAGFFFGSVIVSSIIAVRKYNEAERVKNAKDVTNDGKAAEA